MEKKTTVSDPGFQMSEVSTDLLLCAYVYYVRHKFWSKDFDQWLLTEVKPCRDPEGKLVDFTRYNSSQLYNESISYNGYVDPSFKKLLMESLKK